MMLGMDTFQERLIWARHAAGLTQRKLAKLAGLASSHVQFIETPAKPGKNPPGASPETARRLAQALSVPTSWLLLGEGSTPAADDIRAAVDAASCTVDTCAASPFAGRPPEAA